LFLPPAGVAAFFNFKTERNPKMDARYVQRGDAIDYTPMADVAAGDVVVLANKLVGVAKLDIKAGELGALALTGVYEVAKASGAAFAVGMEVAWDATNRKAVAAGASGSIKMGHAVALAGASDPTVFVRLCQGLS
jgi:predicted RecA/RadA family phage recombinase